MRRHPDIDGPPFPCDLDDAPELASIAILAHTLTIVEAALISAHPHIVGDDFDSPEERIADLLLRLADHTRAAVRNYRRVVDQRNYPARWHQLPSSKPDDEFPF